MLVGAWAFAVACLIVLGLVMPLIGGADSATEYLRYASEVSALLIDEIHGFDEDIHNMLLQRLDMPFEDRLIILATTDARRIPAALMSRCDTFYFRLISDDAMAEVLVRLAHGAGMKLSPSGAAEIARHAGGHARDAVRILERLARSMQKGHTNITDEQILRLLGSSDLKSMADLLASLSRGESVSSRLFRDLVSKHALDFGSLAERVVADAIREHAYTQQAGLDTASPGFWVVARNIASQEFESYRSIDHLFANLSVTAAEARGDL